MNMDILSLRRTILLQLEAASPASLPRSTILVGLETAGFCMDLKELSSELDYLAQKGMITLSRSALSAGELRAKLSADGRDYLESGEV